MRIILLNDRKGERDLMVKALAPGNHRVEPVGDERSALEALGKERADVVLFAAPAKGGSDLVRRFRSRDSSGRAYLIAIVDAAPSAKDLASMLAAGANDFIRRPVVDVELIERVQGPARLLRWVSSIDKSVFDLSAPPELTQLEAWRKLGVAVAEDLGQIAGQSFTVTCGWPSEFGKAARAATIPMSLAGDQLEVRLSICTDAKSSGWVKSTLLGDASAQDPAVDDVLREFANTAGGVLKRTALHESITLTTGIPFNSQPTHHEDASIWSLKLDDGDACFVVVGEVIERHNQRVSAAKLCEGMIVVNDVRSDGGVLLVRGGSRLTSTAAAKLSSILGPQTFIEVAPAA